MKTKIVECDICGDKEKVNTRKLQTIFMTDEEEGRAITPFLNSNKIDICNKCASRVLGGEAIYGKGVMGNNNYSFINFW